jgi:hemolysin D
VSGFSENFHRRLEVSRETRRVAQLKRLEQEFLPPLLEIQETPPSPWQRRVLWTLLLLLLTALIWAYFGKINIVATAQGQFIPDGRVKVVQPLSPGTVQRILVHTGEMVHAGQLLVALNPTVTAANAEATRKELALRRLQQARLLAQLGGQPTAAAYSGSPYGRMESSLRRAEEEAYRSQLAAAQATLHQAQAALAAGAATLRSLRSNRDILGKQLHASKDLAAMGAIPQDDYLKQERELIQLQGQLAAQKQDQLRLTAAVAAAEQSIAHVRAGYQQGLLHGLEDNTSGLLGLEAQETKASHDLSLHSLRAPVDGVVQEVNVTSIGQVVTPAQAVVTVVPRNTPLVVEAMLPNQDMAFVRVGQMAQIKVAAFSFEQYGVIHGKVVQISPDAISEGTAPAKGAIPAGGLAYRVKIQPEQNYLLIHGQKVYMRPGMSVTADINTGRRRILAFFLDPLFKTWGEGLSVR